MSIPNNSTYCDALKNVSSPTSGYAATAKLLLPVSIRTLTCANQCKHYKVLHSKLHSWKVKLSRNCLQHTDH